MSYENWFTFIIADFFIAITPGPAIFLVSMQGFKYGVKPGCVGALGISCCNLLYYFLSASGIAALVLATNNLFEYIKTGGALYLIATGIAMFYRSFKDHRVLTIDTELIESNLKFFIQGFVTQAANPKAILFFVVLLPPFIDFSKNTTLQFFILGFSAIILETLILILYGLIAAKGKKISGENILFQKWQSRIAGFILVGLGIYLFTIKNNAA